MRDWNSTAELQRAMRILTKLANVWLGIYVWELITSMQFERDIITRKKAFQWHMVPYFLSRYSQLIALVCCVYMQNSTSPIDCSMTYAVSAFFELSVVFASINFALRTMAVWSNRSITVGLWFLLVADVVLLVLNVTYNQASWNHVSGGCVYHDPERTYLHVMIMRIYTTVFDALVLMLNAYKLGVGCGVSRRGTVVRILLEQGLIYFIIAFLCNTIAVAFLVWKPNLLIGIVATTPASLFTVIAACRSVRYLSDFMARDCQQRYHKSTAATGPLDFVDSTFGRFTVEDRTIKSISINP